MEKALSQLAPFPPTPVFLPRPDYAWRDMASQLFLPYIWSPLPQPHWSHWHEKTVTTRSWQIISSPVWLWPHRGFREGHFQSSLLSFHLGRTELRRSGTNCVDSTHARLWKPAREGVHPTSHTLSIHSAHILLEFRATGILLKGPFLDLWLPGNKTMLLS